MIAFALLLATLAPEASASAPPPATTAPQQVGVHRLRLDADGQAAAQLRDGLAMRLPDLRVEAYEARGGGVQPGELYARVRLSDRVLITLVTDDGRAFDRAIDPEGDEPVRVAATALSNLVFAVRDGSVEADRSGVEVQSETPTKEPDPAPRNAARETPTVVTPEAKAGPFAAEVGLGLTVGPGRPRGADVFAGYFGTVRGSYTAASGARAVLGVSLTGRTARERGDALGIMRIRVELGGGYGWQRDRLQAAIDLTAFAEPIIVTRNHRLAPLERDGQRRRLILLGGSLRAAAYYRLTAPPTRLAVSLGPFAALAAAAAPDNGFTVPLIHQTFRPGALELTLGLGTVLTF